MIAFLCGSCGKALKIKDELAGKKAKCPQCGHVVLIPAPAAVWTSPGSDAAHAAAHEPGPGTTGETYAEKPPQGLAGEATLGASAPSWGPPATPNLGPATVPGTQAGGLGVPAVAGDIPGAGVCDRLAPAQGPGELGRLGPYRVLKILGQGGMGVVFHAEDTQLKRRVALKAMLPALASSPSSRQRFLLEAQAMAAVEHDNIVSVYQVGEDRGMPYLAMPFLKGETLEARLKREGQLPLAEVLRIGREIAAGLAAAHAKGLIHRDVKPANTWLEAGSGRVKILDFGLTRAANEPTHLTQSGAVVGTPAYMAPEQAEGGAVGPHSDLFSLGCVLYRMCTGEMPFKGHTVVSVLRSLALDIPPPPATVDARVPSALSDLVVRLLSKDAAGRPASARFVVVELERIERGQGEAPLHGADERHATPPALPRAVAATDRTLMDKDAAVRPVAVPHWPVPPVAVVRQPAPRSPASGLAPGVLWAMGAVALLAVVGVAIVAVVLLNQASVTTRPVALGNIPPGPPAPPPLPVQPARDGAPLRTCAGHTLAVWGVAIAPGGKLASSASKDKTVRLWDVDTGREVRTLTGHTAEALGVAFSPDGTRLLSCSSDGTLRLWDVVRGEEIRRFTGHTGAVYRVVFSPSGLVAASAGQDGTVRLWNLTLGKEFRRLVGHAKAVRAVAFSPDGRLLVTGSEDSTVRLWRFATGAEARRLEGHGKTVYGVSFAPDGRRVLTGSADKSARVWDVATGAEVCRFDGHKDEVNGVAFSPDGRHALSGSDDKTVCLWDAATGQEQKRFRGHTQLVFSVAVSSDGRHAVSGGFDNQVQVWDLAGLVGTQRPPWSHAIHRFEGHTGNVFAVAFAPDGAYGLSAGGDRTLRLWDLDTGGQVRRFEGHTNEVNGAAFSPDGRLALSGSDDTTVRLWDVSTGRELKRFDGHTGAVWTVAFSPDGSQGLSASSDGTMRLWDLEEGKEIRRFTGHDGNVFAAAFSRDGTRILSGGKDGTVRLWDAANGNELRKLKGHTGWVPSVALSPNGERALSGGQDGSVRLWDLTTGDEIRRFPGHVGAVYGVAFAHKGERALSGGADKILRLWDVETGQEVSRFEGHTQLIWGVAHSRDGLYALSGGWDKTVRLWQLPR